MAVLWLGCSLNSMGMMTSIFPPSDAGEAGEDAEYEAPIDEPVLLDLGGDLLEEDSSEEPETCVAVSCADMKHECGSWTDGCGNPMDCGSCTAPQSCHGGQCASVIFVDPKATGAKDGSSWTDAFVTIDAALAAAKPGTQVWIAKGVYVRSNVMAPAVVKMQTEVKLYGHFKGDEDGIDQRDLTSKDETVLDGEQTTTVVIGAADSLLDGFTVTKGSGTNAAGVYIMNVTGMTIANCLIKGNTATNAGGGVYVQSGGLVIRNTTITGNQSSLANFGGGVFVTQSKVMLDHCMVSSNVSGTGGGLYALQSDLLVEGSVFLSNRAEYSQSGGGGIYLQQAKTTRISNSVFGKNASTLAYGGGIYNHQSSPDIVSCTFAMNTAKLDGADVFDNVASVPKITNCILWSSGGVHPLWDYSGAGPAVVRYSDVFSGWPGEGNLNVDPKLANLGAGDYGLAASSPCIDAADGTFAPDTDLFGSPRWDDPAHANSGIGPIPYADIGAIEYKK
ncbi:MAG: right-handed parallel beta-helix repeat-containing protein [Deltaproteobacteria bacterium]|nr:right-handed parallel beta-helix repeat-containing protein [Deltaproteobacteria bacterium]